MAKKTVSVITCDGFENRECGKTIAAPSDGIVVFGRIYVGGNVEGMPTVGQPPGTRTLQEDTALCWPCFHKRFTSDSVLAEARSAVASAESRYDYATRSYENERPGNGISGPLLPPELPRCVTVISALIAKS